MAEGELPAWRNAFRLIQSFEAWACHGVWVRQTRPSFGPGVRERFAAAETLDPVEVDDAKALRASIRGRMHELLGDDAILILPTVPGIAPSRNLPPAQSENFRARALELLCLAGHAGLPQISLPVASMEGCPIGLSILAPQDQDEVLMAFTKRLYGACR